MFDMMKQMHQMRKQANEIKKTLDSEMVECTDVKGIKIVLTGSQEIRSVEIDEDYFATRDKAKMEKDLLRSINASLKKSQALAAKKMQSSVPGFPGLK
jgi:DNA-binding YbaB/EbfC family protein